MKKSRLPVIFVVLILCCVVSVKAQTTPPQNDEDKIYKRSEVDKGPRIVSKPRAQTDGKCGRDSSGVTRFELILRKSGTVEVKNVLMSSGCIRFDKNAYEAAKSVKFDPAIKNGGPVSVMVQVEYSYKAY
jgi:TonB family protein